MLLASRGQAKSASRKNNDWAEAQVKKLRKALNMDMSIPLGNLPLTEFDDLSTDFFTRALKKCGDQHPSSSLMNLYNSLNRVMRIASNLRAVDGGIPVCTKAF